MQRSSILTGYQIHAKDGAIGSIDDLLFDDRHFVLRWVVVDTGTWLPGCKVLLPPLAFETPDVNKREYFTNLTRDQIEAAPGLETDKPVSRQLEVDVFRHYSWNSYWYGTYGAPFPVDMNSAVPPADLEQTEVPQDKADETPHLRSVDEVTGYYVEATDGSIGHVEDVMIDEDDWGTLSPEQQAEMKPVRASPTSLRRTCWSSDPDTGTPVPCDGETLGEIVFRGNIVMKGYLKAPEDTAKAFKDGWFWSGDIAMQHPDGYIEIRDRSKDIRKNELRDLVRQQG